MSTSGQRLIGWWDRLKLYFPCRKNFLLFFGFGYLLISEKQNILASIDPNEVFLRKSVIDFLINFFFQVWIVMILISLFSIVFALLYNRSRLKVPENFLLRNSYDSESLTSVLQVDLYNCMRPFLGSLSLRFGVDDVLTPLEYFSKIESQHFHLDYKMQMPFVKRYNFQKTYIIHSDIFNFFRIVYPKQIFDYFTQRAKRIEIESHYPPISLAHDEELESEQIKRVKGEWLHSKTFEPSDDVRRIIWRVYAQNRELVIRERENFSPFTSTVSFYISFDNDYDHLTANPWISDFLLTKYKDATWSIFYDLKKNQRIDIKYIPDQKMTGLDAESPIEHDHEVISISEWLRKQALTEYIYERDSFILCVSPLVSLDNLRALVESNPSLVVYLVVPKLKSQKQGSERSIWHRFVYRKPVGVEERNLRFYKILGHHQDFRKLITEKENFLAVNGIRYFKIEV